MVLNEAGVSRRHARIEETNEGFYLIDEGSTNGTIVDDQRIHRYPLTHGKSFRIHDYLFTFVNDIRSNDEQSFGMTIASKKDATSLHMASSTWLNKHLGKKKGLVKKFTRLLQMVANLYSASADTDIGTLILVALFEVTGAKRGILAKLQKTGGLTSTHTRGFGPDGELPRSIHSLLKRTIDEGTCVYYRCAATEQANEKIVPLDLKSVLCIPISRGNQTVGCLYLDHPEYRDVISEIDRDLVIAAADYIAEAFLGKKGPIYGLGREEERFTQDLAAEGIIARSLKTLKVFQDTLNIARYNVAVLIYGETGTGKEVIARYIHANSGRNGQFIACNCSAIAPSLFESELFGHEKGAFTGATERKPGLLELADHGTIFLDEIGDMPIEQQSKLLRTLQEQEVWRVGGRAAVKIDVRVISATHKDIKNNRKDLKFRDDLYYRLANVEITAPPLRDRTEDIGPLSRLILQDLNTQHLDGQKKLSLSARAVRLLEAYDWPGNIRELRNTLFQVAYRCNSDTIESHHLKDLLDVFEASPKDYSSKISPLIDVERVHIIRAMKHTNWNKSAAAKVLKIDRNRLSRRLKKLGIKEPKK